MTAPGRLSARFDLQAHRGGAGLVTENTLAAFSRALAVGVTTLEFDCHISADEVAVVVHDAVLPSGVAVHDLTLSQLQAIDLCEYGGLRAEEFPDQQIAQGAVVPTLTEVFELADSRTSEVGFNIEIKYDALSPGSGADKQRWVELMAEAVAPYAHRAQIQSFDWSTLVLMGELLPTVRLSALFSQKYLQPGGEGASPWLAGLDIDEYADPALACAQLGFDQISPIHGSPYRSGVGDASYRPYTTPALITSAHEQGLTVVPYVVDDPPTMAALVASGCDGLITNYPDRLRLVLAESGEELPPPA